MIDLFAAAFGIEREVQFPADALEAREGQIGTLRHLNLRHGRVGSRRAR